MWLTKLKIAIVEKNTDSLGELINNIPKLSSKEDIDKAIYLTKEAAELLKTLRIDTKISMDKIKKNLAFLNSTHAKVKNRLDIKS